MTGLPTSVPVATVPPVAVQSVNSLPATAKQLGAKPSAASATGSSMQRSRCVRASALPASASAQPSSYSHGSLPGSAQQVRGDRLPSGVPSRQEPRRLGLGKRPGTGAELELHRRGEDRMGEAQRPFGAQHVGPSTPA
jgi:hypothetical protein